MGDALAIVLIGQKHFNSNDFKKNHPGGMLGRRLSSRVKDIMLKGNRVPIVNTGTLLKKAIIEMDKHDLGVVLIADNSNKLTGIITDGDLRRLISHDEYTFNMLVDEIMTQSPLRSHPEILAYDALNIMEKHQITVLPVTDEETKINGILHLHDILGKGAFRFEDT